MPSTTNHVVFSHMLLDPSQAMFGNVRQLTSALISGSEQSSRIDGIVRGGQAGLELGIPDEALSNGTTRTAKKISNMRKMSKHFKQAGTHADQRNLFVW